MKLTDINIGEYHQFKNFNLNLTYPAGHEKAGQPLDKVCFIGQSGTGKTTLLNLIRAIVGYNLLGDTIPEGIKSLTTRLTISAKFGRLVKIDNDIVESYYLAEIPDGNTWRKKREIDSVKSVYSKHYGNNCLFIYFPAELNTDFNQILPPRPKNISFEESFKSASGSQVAEADAEYEAVEHKFNYFDFEKNNVAAIWQEILQDINAYKTAQLSFTSQMVNKLGTNATAPETFIQEFKAWKANNPNPLVDLADKLNKILHRFNLEIRPEFEFRSEDDLRFINVYQRNGAEIPNHSWSTGTKQLILTATPLLKLNTDKSVILIDEPERSLYPDIQQEIVGYYSSLAPNAQFFYATHSPIIASAFDPWEIIELKFDAETGHVVQESYLKPGQERHVDNYKMHPKYLRWDAILQRVFDLENDGREERQQALERLAQLDIELINLKAAPEKHRSEIQQLWTEFKTIADKLDWKIPDFNAQN